MAASLLQSARTSPPSEIARGIVGWEARNLPVQSAQAFS
jgi:hypothetical protein